MQQVGARIFADAQAALHVPREAIAPAASNLPVPVRHRTLARRVSIAASHAWVLHRRILVRAAGALLALIFIVGVYQVREPLTRLGENVVRMVQGEFAVAGFGIDAIKISGQTLSDDKDIIALLMMSGGSSTLDFDAQKARNLLRWMLLDPAARFVTALPGAGRPARP